MTSGKGKTMELVKPSLVAKVGEGGVGTALKGLGQRNWSV